MSECPSCNGLNTSCPDGCGRDPMTGELNGTRYALPQPSAEPVAWMYTDNTGEASLHGCRLDNIAELGWTETPLYSASALEAARREALDQAAERVEQFECPRMDHDEYTFIREAANAILALKENTNG